MQALVQTLKGRESTASLDTFDDGVQRSSQPWTNGAVIDFSIDLQGSTASGTADVGVWIDWNGDGDFYLEDFFSCTGMAAGVVGTCQITVPGSSVYTVGQPVNVRVRAFDPASLPGGSLSAGDLTGLVTNGEVEDYQWSFRPTSVGLAGFCSPGSANCSLLAGCCCSCAGHWPAGVAEAGLAAAAINGFLRVAFFLSKNE